VYCCKKCKKLLLAGVRVAQPCWYCFYSVVQNFRPTEATRCPDKCEIWHDISIFPQWGHFPSNFQSPLMAKLNIGSKKVRGMQNGTDLLYHHAKYGGDPGSRAGCRQKSVMFFLSVCFFVTL